MGFIKDLFNISSIKQQNKDIINLLNQKSTPVRTWNFTSRDVQLFNFDKEKDIHNALQSVPELTSVISYIGKSFSTGIYEHLKNDKVLEHSEIVNLLNNPNQFQSGSEFKQTLGEQLFAYGRVHLFMNTPSIPLQTKSIKILQTFAVNPYIGKLTDKQILESDDNIILYYEYDLGNGNVLQIPPEKVLTITLNAGIKFQNGYVKYISPLKPLEDALLVTPAIYDTMQKLNNERGMIGFFANSTRSSQGFGIVPLEEDEKKTLQASLANYGTRKGQKQFGTLDKDVDYKRISDPIKDMFLPEQQKMIKTIIADILGFDTVILNNDAANKYANYKEARKSLFTENIIPASKNYTETLTNYFETGEIDLNYSHLDIFTEDEKEKKGTIKIESDYIISLNQSVSNGDMSRLNAVALLESNGYDLITANSLIVEIPAASAANTGDALSENQGASQEQLQAQAGLRGSVGGVQGILAIQSSVSQGTTDYEAAITILIEIYGFTRETAINILGIQNTTS